MMATQIEYAPLSIQSAWESTPPQYQLIQIRINTPLIDYMR